MISFPGKDYCYRQLLHQFTEKIVKLNNFIHQLTQGSNWIKKGKNEKEDFLRSADVHNDGFLAHIM